MSEGIVSAEIQTTAVMKDVCIVSVCYTVKGRDSKLALLDILAEQTEKNHVLLPTTGGE